MSIYLQFGEEQEQVASNKGWSDFGTWADALDHKQYPRVVHLWEHGWIEDVGALTQELTAAQTKAAPSDDTVAATLAGIIAAAITNADADAAVVTDGFSADDDTDDEDVESEDDEPDPPAVTTMLSTLPGASAYPPVDPEADSYLNTILDALAPARQRFVQSVLATILQRPPSEWWLSLVKSLDELREQTGQALAIAKVAFALAAMRRVVHESALRLPSVETAGLPASSPPEIASGVPPDVPAVNAAVFGGPPDGEPFVSLTLIDEAANDLAARNVMTRAEFDRITGTSRQEAFTVASVESEATLGVLRDLVQDAVAQGLDQRQWRAEIDERLGHDPFLSRAHQETVFRANTHAAYTAGGNAILEHPMVADEFPYRAAYPIRDRRARPWHIATATAGLNGTNIYRADDPTWKTIQGPSDYGCRCGWAPVTIAQAARAGVQEAIKWQETGLEPTSPQWVPLPPGWQQSESWVR